MDTDCTQCHDAGHKKGIDLRGDLDAEKVPASYRTRVEKGLVHYADMGWIDLNCPLWVDYVNRLERPGPRMMVTAR